MNEGMVALTQVGCNRFLNDLNDFPLRSLANRCVSVLSVGMKSMILYRGSSNFERATEIYILPTIYEYFSLNHLRHSFFYIYTIFLKFGMQRFLRSLIAKC